MQTTKNNFFFIKYWYDQNFWVCFEWLHLFWDGDSQSMKMHSSGLHPNSSFHLLLLDRSACQESFWWLFEMWELWKRFHFSCHPDDFNPCMHMKESCESLAYSAFLQFSFPAVLTMKTQQYFWSQIQVYLPGITTAVSVKAFSVVKRKSIFVWCLQLEPTLGRNVTILLLSA